MLSVLTPGRSRGLRRLALAFVFYSAAGCVAAFAQASVVKIAPAGSGWKLTRNGQPYEVRGISGFEHLDLARKLGATTIRMWGIDKLESSVNGRPFLDHAHSLGLTVLVGIWVGHERHGFNYSNPSQVKSQRDAVRAAVRKYKNHPAVLVWGLGNEMEDPRNAGGTVKVWQELEVLAKIIKEEDPNHPVCTVIAAATNAKVSSLMEHYPSIDILGVNAYAAAVGTGRTLAEVGWKKPFMLTEFGPLGHWEVGKTSWNAPLEPTSREKARRYLDTHQTVMKDGAGRCLGTFPFTWGQKQETTGTWYGMFLKTGEKLPTVDAMAFAWTGKWPANRSPLIGNVTFPAFKQRVKAGSAQTARAEISDPENDRWTATWIVQSESTDRRTGGDKEAEPPAFPELTKKASGNQVEFTAPSKPGAYRLFLYVRDGKGGASADNFPFFVE